MVALFLLGTAGLATAEEEMTNLPPDKLFASKTCGACHGKEGKKAILAYPQLAGQKADYLLAQMKDIKSGARMATADATGNPRTAGMQQVMHLINDEQMKQLADWLAKLEPAAPKPATPPVDPERLAQGGKLYAKSGCASCHGANGAKPLPGNPILAAQKREYLLLQMKDMKTGARKNGKSATMTSFIAKVGDAEMEQIADFLSQATR
ncbi:MAG: c-type cytochrome [Magnetococcales bacterium]|nr:c-type cytochrome [Magnetococcales bacterium]